LLSSLIVSTTSPSTILTAALLSALCSSISSYLPLTVFIAKPNLVIPGNLK